MANIKLKKPLLSAAILACLFGGALTTIGSITGGVNDLVNSAKSKVKLTKKEESFSELSSLFLSNFDIISFFSNNVNSIFLLFFRKI